jgi:nucleoid-associated protein YgaU
MSLTSIFSSNTKASLQIVAPPSSPTGSVGAAELTLTFPFNPDKWAVTSSAEWKTTLAKANTENPTVEFLGKKDTNIDIELFLDEFEQNGAVASLLSGGSPTIAETVAALLKTVTPTERSIQQKHPMPNWVKFGWGTSSEVTALVEKLSVNYTMFDGHGKPLRATIGLSLKQVLLAAGRQNPTSGGTALLGSHVVSEGDTLASVAYSQYGDAKYWRPLAMRNEIDDPARLAPGTELILPPIEELDELL